MRGNAASVPPPHDLDAESATISAAMIDPSVMDKLAGVVAPEHFYSEANRRIFEVCVALREVGQPVDIVQVGTRLRNNGRIDQVGGLEYLTEILNAAPSTAHAVAYAETVVSKWRLRQLIATCQRIAAEGYMAVEDVDAFVDRAEQSVYQIAKTGTRRRGSLSPLKGDIRNTYARWMEHCQLIADGLIQPGAVMGAPTGFDRLDRILGGLHDGDLTIVAGRPGMAKTAFALALCIAVSRFDRRLFDPKTRQDLGVEKNVAAMFSLEMPREQIAARRICGAASVDLSKARSGDFSQPDVNRIVAAVGALADDDRILIDDTPGLSLMAMMGMVRTAKSELERAGRRLGIVAVDYLTLMEGRKGVESREQAVSEISRGLKGFAKEMKVPIVALAQLNRGVESRADKRPQISDLRESGAIEQDADNILLIYRDEYYHPDSDEKNIAEIIVGKQRNGATGTVKLRFDKEYAKFENLPEGEWCDEG